MKFLGNTVETYRVETENECDTIIAEAKASNMFELTSYKCVKKEVKKSGEVIDEYFVLSLTKTFNNIKEPERHISVNYEVDY